MTAMTAQSGGGSGVRSVSGAKVASAAIWVIGCYMTHEFFTQMNFGGQYRLALVIIIQLILTAGQSPVWYGRGSVISVALLVADALINFGGCLAFTSQLDQTGSIQAFQQSFVGRSGDIPGLVEAIVAACIAALVAGLPEYLWRRV